MMVAAGADDLTGTGAAGSVNMDPELRCQAPQLRALLEYWRSRCGDRDMPSRADLRPADLPSHLPHLVLLDVQQEPLRLRYRLVGTAITTAMQRDNTGLWYDQIYAPELLDEILASYRWILAHRAPLRTYGQAFYPDRRFYRYEILKMPLSSDGHRIDMILGELLFSMQKTESGRQA